MLISLSWKRRNNARDCLIQRLRRISGSAERLYGLYLQDG